MSTANTNIISELPVHIQVMVRMKTYHPELTQDKLSKKIRRDQSLVSRALNGHSPATLLKIERYLDNLEKKNTDGKETNRPVAG